MYYRIVGVPKNNNFLYLLCFNLYYYLVNAGSLYMLCIKFYNLMLLFTLFFSAFTADKKKIASYNIHFG